MVGCRDFRCSHALVEGFFWRRVDGRERVGRLGCLFYATLLDMSAINLYGCGRRSILGAKKLLRVLVGILQITRERC